MTCSRVLESAAVCRHDDVSDATYLAQARSAYRSRRQRDRVFGAKSTYFGEPAWDVLLDLFIARGEGRRISVSSACIAAATATSTGLRAIGMLVDGDLVARVPDPLDRRRTFLELSELGTEMVRSALDASVMLTGII